MKRQKMILAFLIVLIVSLFCACSHPDTLNGCDEETLISVGQSQGYEAVDLTAQLNDDNIISAYRLDNPEYPSITLRYYRFQSEMLCKSRFDALVTGYATEEPDKEKLIKGENYQYYRSKLKLKDSAALLVRVDDTLLYVISDYDYREEAEELAEMLGYGF